MELINYGKLDSHKSQVTTVVARINELINSYSHESQGHNVPGSIELIKLCVAVQAARKYFALYLL